MKRRTNIALLVAVGTAGIALLAGYVWADRVTRAWEAEPFYVAASHATVSAKPDVVAAGRHLVHDVLRCASCHGEDLGGGIVDDTFGWARVVAPALTPGSAAGAWSDDQIATVLRHGVRPDGTGVRFMPSDVYQHLSRDDMRALLSYLRSLPAVDRPLPRTELGPVARVAWAAGLVAVQPARGAISHQRVPPARNDEDEPVAYGRYLGKVGGCTSCHGIYLSGGRIPGTFGQPTPANLTPEGMAGRTRDDLARALGDATHGMRPTDAEIDALWAWLATVPPRATGNR